MPSTCLHSCLGARIIHKHIIAGFVVTLFLFDLHVGQGSCMFFLLSSTFPTCLQNAITDICPYILRIAHRLSSSSSSMTAPRRTRSPSSLPPALSDTPRR